MMFQGIEDINKNSNFTTYYYSVPGTIMYNLNINVSAHKSLEIVN